jgi:thioredoxin
MVKYIQSLAEFQDIMKSEKVIVIDFTAKWCGPCKAIAPFFDEFSKTYNEKIECYKLDVDEMEDIAIDCNISAMPTFQFFKNGLKIDEFTGANAEKLRLKIEKLI